MTPIRVFVSGVQSESRRERRRVRDYLRGDPLMRRFFEVVLVEDAPASDRRPDQVYLDQVAACDIYVGLFGRDYGFEDESGVSPTEREFDEATKSGKHRLLFLKGADDRDRHPKMRALVARAQAELARRRFATSAELLAGLYAALLQHLETKGLLRFTPFDASPCTGAALDDLDADAMSGFVRTARRARQFRLPEETSPLDLLTHLNLLSHGRPTNAAVLLFGKAPQRFLISSEVKCAHFHGTEVAKPIPSHQVYKGTVFELVDKAADFVMGKVDLRVGTRARSVRAPISYEIPKEAVTEAIVNAVAHRDYTDNSSVQAMLFSDRLEVMNTGRLPPPLSVERLRTAHPSLPGNPLIAEAMHLLGYIEKIGTGTVDMIRRCAEAGLRDLEFDVSGGFVTRIWRPARSARSLHPSAEPSRSVQSGGRRTTQETTETTQETRSSPPPSTQDSRAETLPTRERVIALLRSDPTLTRNALASRIGLTPEAIKYHLGKLRAAGRIRHVGPRKKGRWEVLEG